MFIKMPSITANCYYYLNGGKGFFSDVSGTSSLPVLMHVFIFSDVSGTSSLPVLMHVFKTGSGYSLVLKWEMTRVFTNIVHSHWIVDSHIRLFLEVLGF